MKTWLLLSLLACNSLLFPLSAAEFQYHEFIVKERYVTRLCKTRKIVTVNGQFPGPNIEINDGDFLSVNVINKSRYNISVHWHGIRQMCSPWADGPEHVTQCPIRPGGSYKYDFTIKRQEGTLWWHAHSSWLRATVYGAFIIRPKKNCTYPFRQPSREFPILLGEWWDANPVDVVTAASRTGVPPRLSDAFTINGQPGDLLNCSKENMTVFPVKSGETNLLRFVNAALNHELFVSIANHTMTVVAADAFYTKPFNTSSLMIAPGQTTDVLVTMDQSPGSYYIAAGAYVSAVGISYDETVTTAVLKYDVDVGYSSETGPSSYMYTLPDYNDTYAATDFAASIRSPRKVHVPAPVDENLFFTIGLGLIKCAKGETCRGPGHTRFAASMNNVSFVLPKTTALLQAYYTGSPNVFTTDFPPLPPVKFDYTGVNLSSHLVRPEQGTKLYKLKYGAVVQVVLQNTNIVGGENHPIHLHGYDFYVLAMGYGNFNPAKDRKKFNMRDPPMRNTVAVPANGWAVIRFVADNPGIWLMHCHLDVHITWGLAMAFLVENGVGMEQSLRPPPLDLPAC